jgi:regulator of protease activity HflC (stomatin/prohibitin superfamily)/divalent metal cation (Fe/Co/Zn/Cd) transporter
MSNASNEQMFKRATSASLVGLLTQLVLLIVIGVASIHASSPAMYAATWHLLGGLFIWIILWLLFNQRRMEAIEELEAQQLAQSDAHAAALFGEATGEAGLARRRRENLEKYGLNIVAFLVAGLFIGLGTYLLLSNIKDFNDGTLATNAISPNANVPLLTLIFAVAAFIAFLVARWTAGMTSVKQWQGLRAGAATLMGVVLIDLVLMVSALAAYLDNSQGFIFAAIAVPAIMMLIGIEIVLSWMMGLYRPRRTDEFIRPAFDSRVLGWLTRPESLGRIINEMINYQFGYEVSQSWFMKLLISALMPLIAACGLLVIGMTSIVIVAPQQQAVITNMGELVSIKDSGLRLKMPWPFGKARKVDVFRVHQIIVGSRGAKLDMTKAVLWTNQHMTDGEEQYLVTAPIKSDETKMSTSIAAGELIGADVFVKYRINDLKAYVRSARDPGNFLKIISEQAVNRYFATKNIDELLSLERQRTSGVLFAAIKQEVAKWNLGLEIVFVSVAGLHPPQVSNVADKFHEQIDAMQEKQSEIERAKRDAISVLAEVAGSRERALEIDKAIREIGELSRERNEAGSNQNQEDLDANLVSIELLLDDAGGTAAQKLLEARAYRSRRAVMEKARALRFTSELLAYRNAPDYYTTKAYYSALAQGLAGRPKIIIHSPDGKTPTIRVDMKQNRSAVNALFEE